MKIKQRPQPFKTRDVQNTPLDIIGYTEYYLINKNNYVRKIEVAVVRQGGGCDVLLNLETLMKLGIVKYDFLTIDNATFEKNATKLEEFKECDNIDKWGFSNEIVRKVSCKVPEGEKEKKLKEMENRLAEKYTPSLFRDSLEGKTIKMDPVEIVIDESEPESKYPETGTVSRNIPIKYS